MRHTDEMPKPETPDEEGGSTRISTQETAKVLGHLSFSKITPISNRDMFPYAAVLLGVADRVESACKGRPEAEQRKAIEVALLAKIKEIRKLESEIVKPVDHCRLEPRRVRFSGKHVSITEFHDGNGVEPPRKEIPDEDA